MAGLLGIRSLSCVRGNCVTRGCNPSNESGVPADTAALSNGAIGSLRAHVPDRSPNGFAHLGLLISAANRSLIVSRFVHSCLVFLGCYRRWNLVVTNKFVPCRLVADEHVMESAVAGDSFVLASSACELKRTQYFGHLDFRHGVLGEHFR